MDTDGAQSGGVRRLLAGPWPVVLVLLLAAGLRVHHLDADPLWYDEGATWRFSRMSHHDLWFGKGRLETNPPLYYSLQRVWRVFGESEFALRSPAMIFGVLAVGLLYGLGRCLGGPKLGLAASLLLATSSVHVEYSQEARAYAGLAAAVIGGLWALAWLLQRTADANRFIHRRTAPAWIAYTVCVILALYLHNTGFLLPLLATAAAIIWWLSTPQRRVAFVANWALCNGVALAAWTFWLNTVLRQSAAMARDGWWVPPLTEAQLARDLQYIFGQGWLATYQPWIDLLMIAFAGAGVAGMLKRRPQQLLVTLLFVVGVPLVLIVISFAVVPLFGPRVLVMALPIWLLIVAAGLASLRRPVLVAAAAVLLTIIQIRGVFVYYDYKDKGDWKAAADYVRQHAAPDDLILFGDDDFDVCFDYYFRWNPDDPAQPDRLALRNVFEPVPEPYVVLPVVSADALPGLFERYPRVWLINWYPRPGIYHLVARHGRLLESQRFTLQCRVHLFTGQERIESH